jgi:protocatechuate 3,4-dioxygenase beta subunit
MLATVASCGACTIVYPTFQVGTDFLVAVEDHGRPVKGLRVRIGGETSAETDENGFATFRKIKPGPYFLTADHDAGMLNGVNVEVKPGSPSNVIVRLQWPGSAPIPVRSMKGTIRSHSRSSLELLEAKSGRLLKSMETGNNGEFNFEGVRPGLYFLRLIPSGLIAVTIDQAAPSDHLDLDLGWTSCGLWYTDQSKCPHPDLQIGQLSGQVVDPTGAAIPHATILLLDPSQTQAARLQSDATGKFTSPHSLSGTYDFEVTAPGFTPFRAVAHADPTAGRARPPSLTLRLGILGSCSAAER